MVAVTVAVAVEGIGIEKTSGIKTYQSPVVSLREGVLGVLVPAAAEANVLGGGILRFGMRYAME